MSTKSSSFSASDSSPEDSSIYLSPSFIRDRDEKGWKAYFASHSELMNSASASGIFSHISDDVMANQAGILYDYYGMTEETRLEPPSPGHSSTDDKDHVISSGIDIPGGRDELDSPIMEVRHSFSDSAKSMSYGNSSSFSGQIVSSRRPLPPTSPTPPAREKIITPSMSQPPSNSSSASGEEDNSQKNSYNYVQKTGFSPQDKYIFILEAQTSIVQKRGSESLTYVNKGQFYFLIFESQPTKLTRVKTIMHLVFGHEKDPALELSHWKYWYNQQPNPNQRAFDIDIKACQMIDEEIEEVGYNALAFTWNPNVRAKISFRINCLSTDFSAQKGVKGIPLHLQIDTYEDLVPNADPVHRAFCQIKVFRDKGAERKNKDESKVFGKKMVKYLNGKDGSASDVSSVFQMANKVTVLYSITSITTKSVVFCPNKEKVYSPSPRREYAHSSSASSSSSSSTTVNEPPPSPNNYISALKERENKRGFSTALSNANDNLENLDVLPRPKAPRVNRKKEPAVTIYVRKEEEKAYNALMLETPSLDELKIEVSRKYGVPVDMMKHVFKKTKKGILVNMDDQLVELFCDEDDFMIQINFDNQLGHFELILNC